MREQLLKLYEHELQFMRSVGGEFKKEYPKIADRLALDANECADPYVERLLEGVAFLSARVQLKLQSRFPDFTLQLLELVYPHMTAPVPSCAIARFEPEPGEAVLASGVRIPAGTLLSSVRAKGETASCTYRTAHEVMLWPLRLASAEYLRNAGVVAARGIPLPGGCRSGLQLVLEVTGGLDVSDLALGRLPIYLNGVDDAPMLLYELLHSACIAVSVRTEASVPARLMRDAAVRQLGFESDEAMLPHTVRAFDGYRLLQEYFTLPQRFMFADLPAIGGAVAGLKGQRLELTFLFNRADDRLANNVNSDRFALFSTPIVNLFPLTTDRIHLDSGQSEYHVVPDRNRPLDFEVYRVESVRGLSTRSDNAQMFDPFFKVDHLSSGRDQRAYFAVHRRPRLVSSAQRRGAARSSYLGSEVFLSISGNAQFADGDEIRQLEVRTLCTNRDLPIRMAVGKGSSDFTLDSGDPVRSIRVIAGPTRPRDALGAQDAPWRLISHLSLNYLSLSDGGEPDEAAGAQSLRRLLGLYVDPNDRVAVRQLQGIVSAASSSVVRRMPSKGPLCFGNGLEVRLRLDDDAFIGSGAFLLGAVLERFFAKYVTLNSFTQTVLESQQRGEVVRWPARTGTRQLL